jgi:CHAT domain-containing protein
MLLTTRTFESYINNAKVGRSQALQQAMLHVMQNPQFAHPTYWAPYALVGEGGR